MRPPLFRNVLHDMEGFERVRTLKTTEGRLAANFTSFLKGQSGKGPFNPKG